MRRFFDSLTPMADPTPSLQLLRRIHRGDSQAMDALLDRHLAWIEQHVRKRLGPALRTRLETVDLVQETLLEFLHSGPRFEISDEAALRALLGQIIENNLRDAAKYHGREKRDMARATRLKTTAVLKLDSAETPTKLIDQEERRAWIRLALEFLDDDDRLLIRLREWEQRSFAEIGEVLGVSANGARMKYRRALPKLAQQVGEIRRNGLPRPES